MSQVVTRLRKWIRGLRRLPTQSVIIQGSHDEYSEGLLVYRSDELGDGYSSALSEEEVKYDPYVWQSVIRYGPADPLMQSANACRGSVAVSSEESYTYETLGGPSEWRAPPPPLPPPPVAVELEVATTDMWCHT